MTKRVQFSAKSGACEGEIAEPSGTGKVGGVVVIQEWHGINAEMRSKIERFASEGYLAIAPDLYHGKVATNDDEAGKLMNALDFGRAVGEIGSAAQWLKDAVLGFCLGGALSFAAAANVPGLAAVVPFYGVPDLSQIDLGRVTAPILAHFAETDAWASPDKARAIQKELQAKGKPMELHVYQGAGHAFMRSGDPTKYHEASAKLAWERTLAFLKTHLA